MSDLTCNGCRWYTTDTYNGFVGYYKTRHFCMVDPTPIVRLVVTSETRDPFAMPMACSRKEPKP